MASPVVAVAGSDMLEYPLFFEYKLSSGGDWHDVSSPAGGSVVGRREMVMRKMSIWERPAPGGWQRHGHRHTLMKGPLSCTGRPT